MAPKISIIIPIYNVEKYLRECLDSVVNQTLRDIEILCVNDGSPDNSLAILEEYAAKDNRIKIINKENGGYASAINAGLDVAKGDFIQIVESDDFCKLNMCEEMHNRIKNSDADFVTADFYTLKPKLFGKKLKRFKYINKVNIENYNIETLPEVISKPSYPWKSLYRTSFIKENNIKMLQDGAGAYEDLPWNATVLSLAKNILYLPNAYYCYRLFAEGSSTNSGKRSMINYIKRRAQIREILKNNNRYDNKIKEYYWAGALNGCLFFLKKISPEFKNEFYSKMKEFLKGALEENIEFRFFTKKMKNRFDRVMNYNFHAYQKSERTINKIFYLFRKGH